MQVPRLSHSNLWLVLRLTILNILHGTRKNKLDGWEYGKSQLTLNTLIWIRKVTSKEYLATRRTARNTAMWL
jgi:hypothetical protein